MPIETDLILSLGTLCEMTHNLRAFYGVDRSGLLDWFVTPIASIPGLIDARIRIDIADGTLEPVSLGEGVDSIMPLPTGILLHHSFSRDANHRVVADWRSEIHSVAEKYTFLGDRMARWLDGARRPCLFLDRDGAHQAISDDLRAACFSASIYDDVLAALRRSFPAAAPTLIVVNPTIPTTDSSSDIRVVTVGDYGEWHDGVEGHFAGRVDGWRDALGSLDIKLCREQLSV
ncbi:hypothetical protein [Methylosinus sp.]|uniref:hypothetical protein n=1 Tax=Methylosinus sp. TaxID=427 RepID=UPI002F945BF5